ncbi:MAG: hypothetical protein ABW080_17220 [Candidatus Thiodiazotropha sp.]
MPNDPAVGDELTRVFRDGSVFKADDADLNKYLNHLCSGHVPNEGVRHREMNRCQVINTIKTFRFIDSVEKSNKIFTIIIIVLTLLTIGLSYYSVTQSQDSSLKIERLVVAQEHKEKEIINMLTNQVNKQTEVINNLTQLNSNLLIELKEISSSNKSIAISLKEQMAYNKSLKQDAAQKPRSAP